MDWTLFLFFCICICGCIIFYLITKLYRVQEQLFIIEDALDDINGGNLNRRILTRESDMTRTICYNINEIAANDQGQLIRLKQSEQAYKRLMTSLSHDVKTPLTSLVGYLEAIQEKIVTGKEKEEYFAVAIDKAHRLQYYIESLFEWVKLDAKEQIFQFASCDLNELSRDILTDWIPILEDNQFSYDIDIPNIECNLKLDQRAYTRILNNLFQNIILHSEGNKIVIKITEDDNQVNVFIADNGKGIAEKDLPHIFERLYQCDESRLTRGNGLGLAIVKKLVEVNGGTINVESNNGMKFIIMLPKVL